MGAAHPTRGEVDEVEILCLVIAFFILAWSLFAIVAAAGLCELESLIDDSGDAE